MDNPINASSSSATSAAVAGANTATTGNGQGVYGVSQGWEGVRGESHSAHGGGVSGLALNPTGTGAGVYGNARGVGAGVWGIAVKGEGVHGETTSPTFAGTTGLMTNPTGTGAGVYGANMGKGHGVFGTSQQWEGVHGETNSLTAGGVSGIALNPNGTGAGVYGESRGKGAAGYFKGYVFVTGDVQLQGADCAEEFDVRPEVDASPGTVMVIDEAGCLCPSSQAYDRRVAGVVSGAGAFRPAITLDRQDRHSDRPRCAIALVGKVACLADASHGSIAVGDLLTTSPTPGHAMSTRDPLRAFGAVIGKALQPLREGVGLIPVLVALT